MAVIKILKQGESDIESSDISKFAFHSDYPTLKIALQGTFTMTLNSLGGEYNEVTATVMHNLGYKPIVKLGAVIGSQAIEFHGMTIFTNSGILDYWFETEANPIVSSEVLTDRINFRFIAPDDVLTTGTVRINYIIFLDEF